MGTTLNDGRTKYKPEELSDVVRMVDRLRRKDPDLIPTGLWLAFFSEPSALALNEHQPRGSDLLYLIENVDRRLLQTALWLLYTFECHSGMGQLGKHQPSADQISEFLEVVPEIGQRLIDANDRAQRIQAQAYTNATAQKDLDQIIRNPKKERIIISECPNARTLLAVCDKRLKRARGRNRERLEEIRKTLEWALEIEGRSKIRRDAVASGRPTPRFRTKSPAV